MSGVFLCYTTAIKRGRNGMAVDREILDRVNERRRLDRALNENVFTALYDTYDHADLTSPEVLDTLFVDLYESKGLEEIRTYLADAAPSYTSIYRYDPFSIKYTPGDGCFRGGVVHGASEAVAHVFHGLTPDKLQLWRTENEVLVLIDQPSHIMRPGYKPGIQETPTVLFSSSQLGSLGSFRSRSIEEAQIGFVVSYGPTPIQAQPPAELVASSLLSSYADLTFSELEAGRIPRAFPKKEAEV